MWKWIWNNKISTALAIALIAVTCFWWSAWVIRYEVGYNKGKTETLAKVEKAALQQQAESKAIEDKANNDLKAKLEKIEHEKQQTVAANQSMRSELERLQEYINARKLPTGSSSAGKSESDAIARGWALFGQCAKEYAGMAEVADSQRDSLAQWKAYGEVVEGMGK